MFLQVLSELFLMGWFAVSLAWVLYLIENIERW